MHEWDTFAVIIGGSAGALGGPLFVALSIHAGRIAESADLRNRAAQTLVIFAVLLLIGVILAIPLQPEWLLGAELLALGVLAAGLLIILDHRAGQSDSRKSLAQTLKVVNPSTLTAGGTALAGALICLPNQLGQVPPGAHRLWGDDPRTCRRVSAADETDRLVQCWLHCTSRLGCAATPSVHRFRRRERTHHKRRRTRRAGTCE